MKIALAALASSLAVLMFVPDARACSPEATPGGRVTGIDATTLDTDDTSSAKTCIVADYGCGERSRYSGIKRELVVRPTFGDAAPSAYVAPGDATFTLKDGTGAVIATQVGTTLGTAFAQVGATVCIKTKEDPNVDAGADASAGGAEVCSPVTVTTLDVSDAERTAYAMAAANQCATDRRADDGGVADGGARATGGSDGGCNVGVTRPSEAPLFLFGLLAAVTVATCIRRRAIHVGRRRG